MARAYAHLETKSAKIASEFGLDWATKLFGAEAIDSLPKFERGPNKGKPKGFIIWRKATSGGWCRECQSPLAVGSLADAWIGLGQFSLRADAMTGQWLGRRQPLGCSQGSYLFPEGRDRWSREMARREQDQFEELAEWYATATPAQQERHATKVGPEKMELILAYVAEFKIGDLVDVIDLRDSAIIERATEIIGLETTTLPGRTMPDTYASLACGFGASIKCLRHAQ